MPLVEPPPHPTKTRRRTLESQLGLSVPVIVLLAALAVPRGVLHDLDLAGPLLTALLALGPAAIWIVVALAMHVPRPLLTLVAVGVTYGIFLAITHQILWTEAFDGDPPRLGGNLADAPAWAHEALTRAGGVVSSVFTGAVVGLITGGVAAALDRRRRRGDRSLGDGGHGTAPTAAP